MTSSATHPDHTDPTTAQRDGFVPVFWEPVAHTGERLMVGAVVCFEGKISTHRMLRDDVLDSLYGKSADGARKLIDMGLADLAICAEYGMVDMPNGAFGLSCGRFHATEPKSVADALRVAAVLYSSLANLDKLDEADEADAPTQEESNRRFATEVREAVVALRPDLTQYFGRSAVLIDGGEAVRFGFCSMRSVIHFGVLHPVRQPSSVRDARARLWELARARDIARFEHAALIVAAPRLDDPILSSKQRDSARRNLAEIEREADDQSMRFLPVTDVSSAAGLVIEYA